MRRYYRIALFSMIVTDLEHHRSHSASHDSGCLIYIGISGLLHIEWRCNHVDFQVFKLIFNALGYCRCPSVGAEKGNGAVAYVAQTQSLHKSVDRRK